MNTFGPLLRIQQGQADRKASAILSFDGLERDARASAAQQTMTEKLALSHVGHGAFLMVDPQLEFAFQRPAGGEMGMEDALELAHGLGSSTAKKS